ncbi:MAG: preprotein translocase subunit SecG [Gammaproteobacteria bacterium]|nr:preprotein translocase subunit SecG [Gammaproteobacteria bacterium]
MQSLVLLFHIIVALAIIGLILLQQGKGADMGAGFGSGASGTLFGSRGPASFLMKLTGSLMAIFLITSLTLGYLSAQRVADLNALAAPAPAQQTANFIPPVTSPAPAGQQSSGQGQ